MSPELKKRWQCMFMVRWAREIGHGAEAKRLTQLAYNLFLERVASMQGQYVGPYHDGRAKLSAVWGDLHKNNPGAFR